MVYYSGKQELEVISEVFRGSVNDVVICRNRLSASGALYTLLVVRDRECARRMLMVMEREIPGEEAACLGHFSQNEALIFVFPYRNERKFSDFAAGQMTSPEVGEQICINLVMECLSSGLPWPLLYLVLEQGRVQIAQDNTVYFTACLDLEALQEDVTESRCISACARLIMDLLTRPAAGRRKRRKDLKSYELIRKKSAKNAYAGFPELYRDIKLTALPLEKLTLGQRVRGAWGRNRDRLFRVLLVLCILLVLVALAALVTQMIYGDIPWLRLFQHNFDVIGTENLHRGGRL